MCKHKHMYTCMCTHIHSHAVCCSFRSPLLPWPHPFHCCWSATHSGVISEDVGGRLKKQSYDGVILFSVLGCTFREYVAIHFGHLAIIPTDPKAMEICHVYPESFIHGAVIKACVRFLSVLEPFHMIFIIALTVVCLPIYVFFVPITRLLSLLNWQLFGFSHADGWKSDSACFLPHSCVMEWHNIFPLGWHNY